MHTNRDYCHIWLAASYSVAGRPTEAAAEAQEVLRLNPRFTLAAHARTTIPYKNKADREKKLAALRGGGAQVGRGQRSEIGGQKTDDRGRRADGRGQRSEDGERKSYDG